MAFSFDVKKVNTMEHLLLPVPQPKPGGGVYTTADLEGMTLLYEFEFHIFRVATQEAGFGGGGTTTAGSSSDIRRVLHSLVKRISM